MDVGWALHFDAIYCLSLADNIERRRLMKEELRRVGMLDCGAFHWKITVRNAFFPLIWGNPSFRSPEWWLDNNNALNCTMGHYEIMKESVAMGWGHVLILEDDVRFLKDTDEIDSIVAGLPEGYDIAMLDYYIPLEKTSYHKAMKDATVSDRFFRFDTVRLWSCGCYALSRKAMEVLTSSQERFFRPADDVVNKNEKDNLVRVATVRNMAVQDMRLKGARMMEMDKHLYDGIADLKDYNL